MGSEVHRAPVRLRAGSRRGGAAGNRRQCAGGHRHGGGAVCRRVPVSPESPGGVHAVLRAVGSRRLVSARSCIPSAGVEPCDGAHGGQHVPGAGVVAAERSGRDAHWPCDSWHGCCALRTGSLGGSSQANRVRPGGRSRVRASDRAALAHLSRHPALVNDLVPTTRTRFLLGASTRLGSFSRRSCQAWCALA